MSGRLEQLLNSVPPGPWRVIPAIHGDRAFVRAADDKTVASNFRSPEVAKLAALAPDMAQLLLDMAKTLSRDHTWQCSDSMKHYGLACTCGHERDAALLARLDAVGENTNP